MSERAVRSRLSRPYGSGGVATRPGRRTPLAGFCGVTPCYALWAVVRLGHGWLPNP